MSQEIQIFCKGEEIILDAKRCAFWSREKTLIVSDLHLGKAAHFRKSGLAISNDISINDLQRLDDLVVKYRPKKIIVTGDLFHNEHNMETNRFDMWLRQYEHVDFILVKGNHDRHINLSKVTLLSQLSIAPFHFVHQHKSVQKDFIIAGHIHPGVSLKGKARQRVRLPCFIITEQHLILPAFSLFTGLDTKKYFDSARYVVIVGEEIMEV